MILSHLVDHFLGGSPARRLQPLSVLQDRPKSRNRPPVKRFEERTIPHYLKHPILSARANFGLAILISAASLHTLNLRKFRIAVTPCMLIWGEE